MATVNLSNDTDLAFVVPACGMTLEQFIAWSKTEKYPKRGKVMFDRGELVVDMSPENLNRHAALKDALNRVLSAFIFDNDLGMYYPDGATLRNDDVNVSNEPDALFVSWEAIDAGKVFAPPDDEVAIHGSPGWVCEIVSDSSVDKDWKRLRTAYHQAEVNEYWILDARDERIKFHILNWTADGYVEGKAVDGWHRSDVFDREFNVSRERVREVWWRYEFASR